MRGPWIASDYYNDPRSGDSFTKDGWLRTGDVAVIDSEGYIRLVDRTKDLVKSGGEWISSVELENELMAHPQIAETDGQRGREQRALQPVQDKAVDLVVYRDRHLPDLRIDFARTVDCVRRGETTLEEINRVTFVA